MDFTYLHDDELEKIVLGCMLTNTECAVDGLYSLRVEDFYAGNKEHRAIFKAMLEINDAGHEIDPSSLITQLIQDKVSEEEINTQFISDIITSVTIYQNFEQYVDKLKEYKLLRDLVNKCNDIITKATEKELPNISNFLFYFEKDISEITSLRKISGFVRADEVAHRVGGEIQNSKGNVIGDSLTTGFSTLDKATGGLGKGQMIVVAARPGVGKSALALNMCYNIARNSEKAIAYFSLEMSNDELMKRLFSISSGVSQEKINKGFLTMHDKSLVKEAEDEIAQTNMFFEESTNITIDDIVLKSRKLRDQREDLSLIIVDHIGIIQEGAHRYQSDQEKIADFSRKLKSLALELDIPIIVVCHINREADKSDSKIPRLSELRGSGQIENDCDKALLLYRQKYYTDQGIEIKGKGFKKDDENNGEARDLSQTQDDSNGQRMDIIVSKNRQGPTGKTSLLFFPAIGRFSVMSDFYSEDDYIPLKD